jgi:isopenicillin-N epimerase
MSIPLPPNLKDLFLLDPEIVYLNHGSFGACPRPVFDTYQNWQRELERQPVEFLAGRALQLLAEARQSLADYLGAARDDIVFFTNPTTAINMVVRSLVERIDDPLIPGDEILTTDHEYGAMDRTWRFYCCKKRLRYTRCKIHLPVTNEHEFIDRFWTGVTDRTRVIFISHITSPTGLIFPVSKICQRAREAGIIIIIDGAHAPGQIPVNMGDINADIYTGACHKWLMAPKGSAFLFARSELQCWLEPLIVSWGYESEKPSGSLFIDYHEWQGTRELAPFLSVPAAIQFQEINNWDNIRERCHLMAIETQRRISELTGLEPISPIEYVPPGRETRNPWFLQMFSARLPSLVDVDQLKQHLHQDYRIEVPVFEWNNYKLIRVSYQGYNDQSDVEILIEALSKLIR